MSAFDVRVPDPLVFPFAELRVRRAVDDRAQARETSFVDDSEIFFGGVASQRLNAIGQPRPVGVRLLETFDQAPPRRLRGWRACDGTDSMTCSCERDDDLAAN